MRFLSATENSKARRRANPKGPSLHGRRQGRPLRAGLRALVDQLLPSLRLSLPGGEGHLDPATLFDPPAREVWLEIGFGGGEHLAWQAQQQAAAASGTGLIGVEVYLNGIATLLRALSDDPAALARLRLYQGDARELLPRLPENSLARVMILFPDPWPKTRHHKRRLIQRDSLDLLALALQPNGELRVATDDPGYLTWIMARLQDHTAFEWCARGPEDWRRRPADWPATRYEEKALAAGPPLHLPTLQTPRRKRDAAPIRRL